MWISCRVRSDSHTLNEAALRLLTLPESEIRISEVSEREFLLSVHGVESAPEAAQVLHVHYVIRTFLLAMNVATVGMFYWAQDPWVHPVLQVSSDFGAPAHSARALVARPDTVVGGLKELDAVEVQNAAIIFGALARDRSDSLEAEYSKGLLLLRMRFFDVDFRREAFLCFYRALESFVATRILRVKKFKNDLKDLERGIGQLGASQELLEELQSIYTTRSSQVAHAQVTPRDITLEEVMKTKTFLDFVMHKTFKAQGVEAMKARRVNRVRKASEPDASDKTAQGA